MKQQSRIKAELRIRIETDVSFMSVSGLGHV